IENTQDSIWSVDANYRLIVLNATFKRLLSMAFHGRPTEGLVFMEYMPLEFKSAWKDFFDRALRGERFSVDYRYDFPNKPLDFEIAFNPIVAADGNITGVAVFARNVTERKHLELQQQRLTTALESAGEMILITDADVKIQYVNAAFEHITGYTRDEARGQNPNMLQGAKQEDEFYRAMWSALRQGDVWHGVVTDKKKSGDLFESENTIAPIYNASGNTIGYVSVQRDITERVQRERELEAIAQLSTALRTAATLIDMTPLLLDQLLDLLKVDSVALIMRDEASGDSVVEAIRGDPILIIGDRLAAGKGIAGYVMESGQPYLTQDVENDSRFMRRIMIQGQWAVAFAPLATRDQIIGVLFIARQSATIPTEDLRLLNTIGELAASAIHRASLHEQTRRRLGQLATLHNIDRAISSSFDLRLTLNIALDELTQYAGVGAASVLFLNSHFMMLEYAAERGFPRQTSKSPQLNINHSFAGRAVLERQAVVADLTAFKGFPHLEALAKDGFTRYDGVPLIAKGKIKGVLEVFSRPSFGAEQSWVEFLETVANGVSLAIDNMELFNGLQRSNSELGLAYDATLEGWSRALDLRDKETEGHTQRVTEMTLHLAHAMNIEVTEITQFRRGALLHDIGKLGVPDNILLKPGPLSDEEWDVMRKHPQYAYDMLLPIPFLTPALAIPYCHHEKWDGSGYPRGLRGESIPLAARIFAVADVWDALRSDRPYRKGWEEEKVRDHIRGLPTERLPNAERRPIGSSLHLLFRRRGCPRRFLFKI
ncbi:MAG: PAS domain S-box protein, partial [Chloroflexi bacterium]|nr:PAS domain S-box protein [Chloroflexota bacterium]